MHVHHNPNYIHHKNSARASQLRELVFGMEDGMVSTLGAVTGIAAATQDPFTTMLAGLVVIAVESISMGVGSYLSSKSVRAIAERKLHEEREEISAFPEEERAELVGMYVEDGWTRELAEKMAEEASQNKELILKEMALRELKIIPDDLENPLENGVIMGVSYVVGGAVPLVPYFIFSMGVSIPVSIGITLVGLFLLGVYTASHSKRSWWKSGLEMFGLASAAALVGYVVGQLAERLFA